MTVGGPVEEVKMYIDELKHSIGTAPEDQDRVLRMFYYLEDLIQYISEGVNPAALKVTQESINKVLSQIRRTTVPLPGTEEDYKKMFTIIKRVMRKTTKRARMVPLYQTNPYMILNVEGEEYEENPRRKATMVTLQVMPQGFVESIVSSLNDKYHIPAHVVDEIDGTFTVPTRDMKRFRKAASDFYAESDPYNRTTFLVKSGLAYEENIGKKRKALLRKGIRMIKQEQGTRPPKEWWGPMRKIIKKGYPGRDKVAIDRITAGIWHHYPSDAKVGILGRIIRGTGGIPSSYEENPAAQDRLIGNFGSGAMKGKAGALSIEGNYLYSYAEPIVQRHLGVGFRPEYMFYITDSPSRSSVTTSRHINTARRILSGYGNVVSVHVPLKGRYESNPAPRQFQHGAPVSYTTVNGIYVEGVVVGGPDRHGLYEIETKEMETYWVMGSRLREIWGQSAEENPYYQFTRRGRGIGRMRGSPTRARLAARAMEYYAPEEEAPVDISAIQPFGEYEENVVPLVAMAAARGAVAAARSPAVRAAARRGAKIAAKEGGKLIAAEVGKRAKKKRK